MKLQKNLTAPFACVQAGFWTSFCLAVCFAASHLQALGFSNTELGIVMAIGNVLGAALGPVLASVSERRSGPTAAALNLPLFALRALLLAALLFLHGHDLASAAVYALYMAVTVAVNALNLKFCVDAEQRGIALNYGVARGAGSLSFVLLSAAAGWLFERFSWPVLVWTGFGILVLQLVANVWTARVLQGRESPVEDSAENKSAPSSLFGFFRSEPRFSLFLLGSVLLYFAHNTTTNFMINLTRNVGGDAEAMGYLNAFMAAVEIPVMLLFARFSKGRRVSLLLAISVAAFLLKSVALALAPNLPLLACALLLQAPSFALYTCAIVPYVSAVIAPQNAGKAQSLAFSVTTLGAVAASLIAGRLYDIWSVQNTLLLAACACAVGVGVCLPAIRKTDAREGRSEG